MSFDYSYGEAHDAFISSFWGHGYPDCHEERWVPLTAKNGVGFGRVDNRIVQLTKLLLDECIDRGYPPKSGQCWGSVCRCSHKSDGSCAEDGAGNPIPSNHSRGIAIDFNSLDNPYGSVAHKMPSWVPALFHKYGFRYLGPPINDWQHFDFAGTPTNARRMTRKAKVDFSPTFTVKGKEFKKLGKALLRAKLLLQDGAKVVKVRRK